MEDVISALEEYERLDSLEGLESLEGDQDIGEASQVGQETKSKGENEKQGEVGVVAALKENRTKDLKKLWASAYDGWTKVPGADEQTMYLCPTTEGGGDENAAPLPLPPIAGSNIMFAISAMNPLGIQWGAKANEQATQQLKKEVERLSGPKPKGLWGGHGFGTSWREDGYVVAYSAKDADKGRSAVIELGKKYGQGAVYEYSQKDEFTLTRKTLPVLLKNVEDQVDVRRCSKPTFLEDATKREGSLW
mmetsp:Transcript_36593/g.44277  ORF Transcript_36593/g.44277 Transcript_36593/m.44277 type:complete len:248 (-) Transcript_36593:52-795(-)|eukprot:CAMPEP_0197845186 /NCGR_PEP_ID=MMETSP1438-20131217/2139_1 /TAXON_ID=1461541 /ORGANISM="Pterosperma sp., Strain CCMP1384" /LENGTH=247 /DNA_ID=CAMNT_0043456355 /DNA_START=143 /DNA_END=886 /DNA_ORIENTATION=+